MEDKTKSPCRCKYCSRVAFPYIVTNRVSNFATREINYVFKRGIEMARKNEQNIPKWRKDILDLIHTDTRGVIKK